MTARGSRESPGRSGNPPEVGAPTASLSYEPSHVIQLLVEAQRENAANSAKLDRLIQDVGKNGDLLDGVRHTISRFEGIGIAAVVLFAVFGVFVWWLIGDQIGKLRDELYRVPTSQIASPTEPATTTSP
jgi:hypothetical protein